MNVVMRDKNDSKIRQRLKNELVRKDVSVGIRGNISTLPPNKVPRYQFNMEMQTSTSRVSSMGPPSEVPRSFKRKLISNSSSAKPKSSSSGIRPRVLASDSGAETSHGFFTPKNRPQAIRYISSSSRGGYSGTKSARSTSNSVAEASVILAISEGRGIARGEIGMAAVDLRHPNLVLCQFSDTLLYTHTMTKINYFHPVEIIVPHTFCEGAQPSQLYKLIKDHYPSVNLSTVQRRHFNDAAGRQQIQTLCAPQYSAVCLQVLQKFYALTSAAALLKYVEYIQCVVFLRESLKIEYHSSEDTMIIDVGTATQLELVQPLLPSAGVSCCLLGVLGPTYTLGGIRALRANILQPSFNKQFIEARLDSVQELIESDAGLIVDLQNIIRKLSEIDKILFLCMETPNTNIEKFGTAQLNQILLLKTTMENVPRLVEALEFAESARLRSIQMDFKNPHYHEIHERILTIIQKDAHLEKGAMGSMQRCFAVKPDINGLLDVARRTYSELIDDIQKLVEQLGETHGMPLRLNQNVTKGFHVVMPVAPKNRGDFSVNDLPDTFLQAHFNGTSVTMTTEDLVVLDQQAKETLNEIQKMSNIVISELLKELRPFMSSLYKLCEDVAELDVLLALAQASSVGSYIRPEFNSYLEVRNCVHPLLDYNSQKMPVPNDIYASPEYNFTIITGPNMGGKSIYIKQVAIMQIMAQLGCFLPATNAVLRLCDRIFSRIGFNDSVELNASSFVIEMKETQHILKGLTSTSLVIIDELCRGTCSEEGTSLAWAICEELINSNAFTFFTTHFLYLTRLQELYYNVVNRHTSVAEEIVGTDNPQIRLIYKHKIEVGVTKIENYGLSLAAMTNMPEETVNLARELVELIDEPTMSQPTTNEELSDDEIIYKLKADIAQQTRKHPNSKDKVNEMLQKFKTDNPQIIQRIKAQKHLESTSNEATKESSSENCSRVKYSTSNDSASKTEDQNTKKSESIQDKSTSKDSVTLENYPNNLSNVTSAIENEYKTHNADNKYASVKLSTELLNTVSAQSKLDHISEVNSPEENNIINTPNVAYNKFSQPSKTRLILNDEDENDLSPTKIIENAYRGLNGKENSLLNNLEATEDIAKSFNSDNNGADALTQVVEKYVLRSSSSSVTNSDMSIDEELFQETIMDIQNDSNNFNGGENILTPPCDFRDF